jgi:hypothetical protein
LAGAKQGRETAAILLVSVVAHGLLLVWLIRSIALAPPMPAARPFQVSLVPALQRMDRRAPSPAAAQPSALKSGRPAAAAPNPSPPPSAAPPAPAQPSPGQPPSAAVGAAPTISAGPSPDEAAETAVRRALRATLGCAHPDFAGLTLAERDDCSRQTGRQAAIGAQENLERVPEEKRVYYAKVQKAYQDIRTYGGLSGTPIPGHLPGIGCRIKFGIPKGWKGAAQPPHSLKLGKLPCFIIPPAGILTPEADIPAP